MITRIIIRNNYISDGLRGREDVAIVSRVLRGREGREGNAIIHYKITKIIHYNGDLPHHNTLQDYPRITPP